MDLQKDKKDLSGDIKSKKEITNNNLFIGSTTDLQRLFAKHDKENEVKTIDVDSKEQ